MTLTGGVDMRKILLPEIFLSDAADAAATHLHLEMKTAELGGGKRNSELNPKFLLQSLLESTGEVDLSLYRLFVKPVWKSNRFFDGFVFLSIPDYRKPYFYKDNRFALFKLDLRERRRGREVLAAVIHAQQMSSQGVTGHGQRFVFVFAKGVTTRKVRESHPNVSVIIKKNSWKNVMVFFIFAHGIRPLFFAFLPAWLI